jgi:glycosyltransferase involved in cell wall biosynthesis
MKKVSAIICAYNEEKTIEHVIFSVTESKVFDEVIVVNDGSTDRTEQIVVACKKSIDLIDIHLPQNKGKGYAMALGIEQAKSDIVLFIDADLSCQDLDHIDQLVKPLLRNEADMTLGYTTVNIFNRRINPMKILTGERAMFKKDILPLLDRMKESRFGVETLLYMYYRSEGLKMNFIHMKNLRHLTKYGKSPFFTATQNYFFESYEIAATVAKNLNLLLSSIKIIIRGKVVMQKLLLKVSSNFSIFR